MKGRRMAGASPPILLSPLAGRGGSPEGRAAATRWARGGYGRRLCHSSGPMARIATVPRFAPDTRNTLSRDPRDFHHGLLTD